MTMALLRRWPLVAAVAILLRLFKIIEKLPWTDRKPRVDGIVILQIFSDGDDLVASHPDFDDAKTAEMIEANQQVLRDNLRMWHGPRMSKEESDRILSACFPDES